MNTVRRRGATALTAAIALALGGIPAAFTTSSILAAGEGPTTLESATTIGDAGKLTLATSAAGGTGTVTYQNGASQATQALEKPKRGCTLITDSKLLTFAGTLNGSAAPGGVGFDGNSIGVAEKANGAGTSCAQVDSVGLETLTLALGTDLPKGTLMSSAHLDLEFKGSAIVTGTAFRGTTQVGVWDKACNDGAADSGPDAKSGDNCRRTFGAPSGDVYFDKLVLSVQNGSFSLEGGADWADPDVQSEIELVNAIDCNASTTLQGSGGTPTVTATRLDNATSGSTCSPFVYTFTNGDKQAEFVKPLTDQPDAQFVFDFDWTIDPANTSDPSKPLVNPTTADYDGAGGNDPVKLTWCPDLVPYTTPGGKSFLVVANAVDKPDQAPGFPTAEEDTTQFACIVSQKSTLVPGVRSATNDDKVLVHEQIYVYGDIIMRKP